MTTPHPSAEIPAELQPRLEAARLLDRLVRRLLSEEGSLHAETWILSLGRLAGTALRRDLLEPQAGGGWGEPVGCPGVTRSRSAGLGTTQAGPALAAHGRRLVDLLLQVLAGLGMPLAEEAIDPPADACLASRFSLAQTRICLDPLLQACGRTHGLGPGAMADALTIAAALAVVQCTAVLPAEQGAGLAVAGLVEGARMAEAEQRRVA